MKCPNCHNKTKVMHTTASVGIVIRYRLCMTCGYAFRTKEREEKRQQAPQIRRKYQHVCKQCGARFINYSTRTKLCPECAEAKQ